MYHGLCMIMLHDLFHAITAKFFEDRLGQDDCHHCLADDTGSWNHTDIATLIATLVDVFTSCQIDRRQGMSERRNGLDTNTHHDWLSVGDASLDSSGVVGEMRPATVFTVPQD